jgi:hypothetical protein
MPTRDPCSELSRTVTELAMAVGRLPDVKNLDDVLGYVQQQIPEFSRAELVNSINEATAAGRRAMTEITKKLAALKREARNDAELRAAIEAYETALRDGESPPAKTKPRAAAPEAIAKLREQRKQAQAELDKVVSSPKDRARVEARIAELDKHLKAGTIPASKPRKATPADLAALRRQRGELRAKVMKADPKIRAKLNAEIAAIEQHIRSGTVPAKTSAAPGNTPADVAALRDKRAKLAAEMQRADPAKRRALRDEIAALEKNISEGSRPLRDPEKADTTPADLKALREERDGLKQRMEQEDTARAKIAELEKHLRDGTLPAPDARSDSEVDPEVQALRDAADALQNALRNSDPALRARFESQIAELTEQLETGVVAPEPRVEPEMTVEAQRLAARRDRLRKQVRMRIADLKPKHWFTRATSPITGTMNAARAVMTSMDFSAVFRQGGFIVLGNPARAAKALAPMFRAFASKDASHAINTAVMNRDNAYLYDRAGLYVAPDESTDGTLSKQEEAFMSRLAGKIPLVAGSQRAYVTFLNVLRADSFDAMAATLAQNGEPTQVELEAIANFVNVATGRGKLSKLEPAAVALNTVFFAPRYVASRFQVIAGQPFYGGNARSRKLIAQEYGKTLTGLAVVFILGALAGAEIEFGDGTSSDFLKLRFGDTRIDPMMGLAQAATFMARSGKGIYDTAMGNEPEGFRKGTVAGRFVRSKLAPAPAAIVDVIEGEDIVGEPVTLASSGAGLVTPISFGEIREVMEAEGVERGTAFALLNLFGMSVQHYEEKVARPSRVARAGREGREGR